MCVWYRLKPVVQVTIFGRSDSYRNIFSNSAGSQSHSRTDERTEEIIFKAQYIRIIVVTVASVRLTVCECLCWLWEYWSSCGKSFVWWFCIINVIWSIYVFAIISIVDNSHHLIGAIQMPAKYHGWKSCASTVAGDSIEWRPFRMVGSEKNGAHSTRAGPTLMLRSFAGRWVIPVFLAHEWSATTCVERQWLLKAAPRRVRVVAQHPSGFSGTFYNFYFLYFFCTFFSFLTSLESTALVMRHYGLEVVTIKRCTEVWVKLWTQRNRIEEVRHNVGCHSVQKAGVDQFLEEKLHVAQFRIFDA